MATNNPAHWQSVVVQLILSPASAGIRPSGRMHTWAVSMNASGLTSTRHVNSSANRLQHSDDELTPRAHAIVACVTVTTMRQGVGGCQSACVRASERTSCNWPATRRCHLAVRCLLLVTGCRWQRACFDYISPGLGVSGISQHQRSISSHIRLYTHLYLSLRALKVYLFIPMKGSH